MKDYGVWIDLNKCIWLSSYSKVPSGISVLALYAFCIQLIQVPRSDRQVVLVNMSTSCVTPVIRLCDKTFVQPYKASAVPLKDCTFE